MNANRGAIIPLQLRTSSGQIEDIDALIDTGFSGYLTLSPGRIASLQLPFFGTTRYELGGGSQVVFSVHTAKVIWEGQDRDIYVQASDGGALVGMQMLYGYRLFADIVDGGEVLIEPH